MQRESGTQMASTGTYFEENSIQKVIIPRQYFSADQLRQLKEKKVGYTLK